MDGKYYFAGYSTGRSLYEITKEQAEKLTHLNVAFATVSDGKLTIDAQRPYLSELERIRKHNGRRRSARTRSGYVKRRKAENVR